MAISVRKSWTTTGYFRHICRMKKCLLCSRFCLALIVLLTPMTALHAKKKVKTTIDKRAEQLSKMLQPAKLSQGNGADLKGASERLTKILNFLNEADKSNGPSAEHLIAKAYSFRDDLSICLRNATESNVIRQFQQAQMLGLFNKQGKLTMKVTKGRHAGADVRWQHIVPPQHAPNFTKSMANL